MKKLGMVWLVLVLVLAGCKEEKDDNTGEIDISKGRNDCEKRGILFYNARTDFCEKNKNTDEECECFLQGKDLRFDEVSKQTVCVAVEADDPYYPYLNPLQGAEQKCEGEALESSSLCLNNLTQCSNCMETSLKLPMMEDWAGQWEERVWELQQERWAERKKQILEEEPTADWERLQSEQKKLDAECEAELKEKFREEWEKAQEYYKGEEEWKAGCSAYFKEEPPSYRETREEQMTGSE